MATIPRVTATPVVFCYNGVNNSPKDAQKFAKHVQRLVRAECHLRYNSATCPTIMSALGKIGAASTVIGIVGAATAGIGAVATAAIITAAGGLALKPEIDKIQKVKARLATKEAQAVLKVLKANPNAHIVLVGHSQGADLIRKILDNIEEQEGKAFNDLIDRISAITIGGLDVVHCNQAVRVFNLCNKDDNIARYAAPIYKKLFLPSRSICHSSCCVITDDTGGHGTDAYLKNKTFVLKLRECAANPSIRFAQAIVRREIETRQEKIEERQLDVQARQKTVQMWLKSPYANDWIETIERELQYMADEQYSINGLRQEITIQLQDVRIDKNFREIKNRQKKIADFQKHLDVIHGHINKLFEEIVRTQETAEDLLEEESHITLQTSSRRYNICERFFKWLS